MKVTPTTVLMIFSFINFQWYEEDLIAAYGKSRFNTLVELLQEIKDKPKTIKASVVRGVSGSLDGQVVT